MGQKWEEELVEIKSKKHIMEIDLGFCDEKTNFNSIFNFPFSSSFPYPLQLTFFLRLLLFAVGCWVPERHFWQNLSPIDFSSSQPFLFHLPLLLSSINLGLKSQIAKKQIENLWSSSLMYVRERESEKNSNLFPWFKMNRISHIFHIFHLFIDLDNGRRERWVELRIGINPGNVRLRPNCRHPAKYSINLDRKGNIFKLPELPFLLEFLLFLMCSCC